MSGPLAFMSDLLSENNFLLTCSLELSESVQCGFEVVLTCNVLLCKIHNLATLVVPRIQSGSFGNIQLSLLWAISQCHSSSSFSVPIEVHTNARRMEHDSQHAIRFGFPVFQNAANRWRAGQLGEGVINEHTEDADDEDSDYEPQARIC